MRAGVRRWFGCATAGGGEAASSTAGRVVGPGVVLHFKAPGSRFMPDSRARTWGDFVRYVEVGDDQLAVRQVEVFGNGMSLRYDRAHWCDEYGRLLGLRFSRKRKWAKFFAGAVVIDRAEFEKAWGAAGHSAACRLQAESSRVAEWGPRVVSQSMR